MDSRTRRCPLGGSMVLWLLVGAVLTCGCSLSRGDKKQATALAPAWNGAPSSAPAAPGEGVALATYLSSTPSRPAPLPRRGVVHVDQSRFEAEVLRSDVPVLVDFYAEWCGPCKKMGPVLEEFAQENPNARIVKVNVDENPELAARYHVQSLPSLCVFNGGQVVSEQRGAVGKARLKSLLGL